MTQNSYLKLLRQYAGLARRYNRSYAGAVHAIITSRVAHIASTTPDQNEREESIMASLDMAAREYGVADRDFDVNSIPE